MASCQESETKKLTQAALLHTGMQFPLCRNWETLSNISDAVRITIRSLEYQRSRPEFSRERYASVPLSKVRNPYETDIGQLLYEITHQ